MTDLATAVIIAREHENKFTLCSVVNTENIDLRTDFITVHPYQKTVHQKTYTGWFIKSCKLHYRLVEQL